MAIIDMELKPIGVIHTPYLTKEETPIQGGLCPDVVGRIELFAEYAEGLKDVEGFSHLIILYWFDKAGEVKLVRPTFLDDEAHGVFASRHPCRPNGIGFTIVELIRREGNILHVGGVDMLDGTPLIDVKPYIARFDNVKEAMDGWVASVKERKKPTGRE